MFLWHIIAIQALTFLVIILFLRLLFHKHLSVAMRRLQELHKQNLDKEVSLNKELERAKQQRQLEVEKGKEEGQRIKDTARQEVEFLKSQLLGQAKQEADRLLKEATQECLHLKEQAVSQVEESGVKLAFTLISEVFSEKARLELHKEFVDELIEELKKIDKERLKTGAKRFEIATSYPLLDAQKSAISDILNQASGCALEMQEKIDLSVISGLVINLGGLILDGSLSSKLRKIIPLLKGGR